MKLLNGFLLTLLLACPLMANCASIDDYAIEEDEFLKNLESMQKNEHQFRPKVEREEYISTERKKGWQDEVHEFWAMLKPDSPITEVDGKKQTFIVPKKIYVRVRKEKDNYKNYFLLNKENKVRYQTLKENLIAIENVANLQPAPKRFMEYGPPREYDAGDSQLLLKPYYALHFESLSDQGEKAQATRNELKVYYGWKIPVEFGLSVSLEKGTQTQSETSTEQVTFQSFYLGPMIRYLPYQSDNFILSLEGSFQKSMNYEKVYANSVDRYSSDVFEFGAESIFPTFIGQLTAGVHWRLIRSALDSSDDPTHAPRLDKSGQSAFAFSVGYGREFRW